MAIWTRRAIVLATAIGLAAAAPLGKPVRAESIVASHYGALMHGAPLAIAIDKGWFKEAGLDIDGVLTSKGGGTSVRNLMAGDTIYGEVALVAAVAAVQQGFDVRIIGSATVGAGGFFITRPGETIANAAALNGKRLAYSQPNSVSEAIWLAVLQKTGLTTKDVQMVATGDISAGMTALDSGKVDIAIIAEPLLSLAKKRGHDFQVLDWLNEDVPPYTQTVSIATVDAIAHHADQIRKIMQVRDRAVRYMYDNPQDAAKSIAHQWRMDPAIVLSSIQNTRKLTDHWWTEGALDMPSMNNAVDAAASSGDVKLPVDWKAAIDMRFLQSGS